MKNIISLVLDFIYSSLIALLPTVIFFLVADQINPEFPVSNTGRWLLLVISTMTIIIFIIRRLHSRTVYNIMGLIFLLSMFAVMLFILNKNGINCRHIGGTYLREPFDGVLDIKGELHQRSRTGFRDYSWMDKVCYITNEQLEKIDPEAPSYKYIDFVIKK